MKKVVLLLLVSLGLVALSACGEEESEIDSDNPTHKADEDLENDGIEEEVDPADEGPTTDNPDLIEDSGLSTDDPVEIIENKDLKMFEGSSDDYKITRYTSDDQEDDGFIHLDKEGYEIKFNVIAGESEYGGEDTIFVVGEQENTNEDGGEMQMNQYEMKTSEGEKLDDGWNYSSVEGGIKDKVANEFELEYDIPDEIELHVSSIYQEDSDKTGMETDEGGYRENAHEVDKTFTFTKE